MRVLFIEPDRALARIIKSTFSKAGYKVDLSSSGQQGIDRADDNRPDIVVLELLLSGHSGVEFLYEFRSHADWHHIPVLIYSNVKKTELSYSQSAWRHLNIKQYFYKPETSVNKLLESVQKISSLTEV